MNVLVTAASKQGSTYEIAETIGRVLRERGFDSTVRRAKRAFDRLGALLAPQATVIRDAQPRVVPQRGGFS